MKNQPNKDYKSNDVVYTPRDLTQILIKHFKPDGKILEPCKGDGAFSDYMNCDWCEISLGIDFFDYNNKVDWIITNPPWSLIRKFLQHSMSLSNNVCFLITINHLWTKARIRDIKEYGFGIKEILIFDTPKSFPQSGFQVGMVHIQKGYNGNIIFNELNNKKD